MLYLLNKKIGDWIAHQQRKKKAAHFLTEDARYRYVELLRVVQYINNKLK